MANGKRQPDQLPLLKPTRAERIEMMDEEILDVAGAARVLGVSTRTVYNLARKGEIPAMRIGREWRFARKNLVEWVINSSQADQLTAVLRNGRVARKR
jgi:excisionase family DNA binding protein